MYSANGPLRPPVVASRRQFGNLVVRQRQGTAYGFHRLVLLVALDDLGRPALRLQLACLQQDRPVAE
ncbi:MAG TPA: hypothetical protein VJ436_05110 [Anaerolineales bacterium]|nr:hypothetical protein [Anaerolineales bacterium]